MEGYLKTILRISEPYLKRSFSQENLDAFLNQVHHLSSADQHTTIKEFCAIYYAFQKEIRQQKYKNADAHLDTFISNQSGKVKALWNNCLESFKAMKSESVQLMVTSPPYYNARAYSQWNTLDEYLKDMTAIIKESYRVLDNHRAWVFNVGDITGNDHRYTKSSWGARRIPLGAYFINIFEQCGFRFIDDFIWDKGEPESQRHKNGDAPYPLYQYPMNAYEHIMIFYKHEQDDTLYPCPICGCLKVNGNAHSGVGIRSWECKNLECFERSKSNRGKRFSARSVMMNQLKTDCNMIDADFVRLWRKDIIKINPVVKINCNGNNILGHTAPFPFEIPKFAIKMLTGVGEIVVDPFAGSFTSAIQAQKMGRIGVGIEMNKKDFRKSIITNVKKHNQTLEEYKCQTTRKSK